MWWIQNITAKDMQGMEPWLCVPTSFFAIEIIQPGFSCYNYAWIVLELISYLGSEDKGVF